MKENVKIEATGFPGIASNQVSAPGAASSNSEKSMNKETSSKAPSALSATCTMSPGSVQEGAKVPDRQYGYYSNHPSSSHSPYPSSSSEFNSLNPILHPIPSPSLGLPSFSIPDPNLNQSPILNLNLGLNLDPNLDFDRNEGARLISALTTTQSLPSPDSGPAPTVMAPQAKGASQNPNSIPPTASTSTCARIETPSQAETGTAPSPLSTAIPSLGIILPASASTTATRLTHSSYLNRADLFEIYHNSHLLSLNDSMLLQRIRRKLELFPQRFADDYLAHSSILIHSSYPSIDRYSLCCVRNLVNRSGLCRLHTYCPYCSYLNRQRTLQTYLPSFHRTNWHFLTLAFDGSLPYSGSAAFHCLDYWTACGAALRQLCDDGLIHGAFWVEELKLVSLLPLRVMPHVHALVDVEDFGPTAIATASHTVAQHRTSDGTPLALPLNLHVKSIPTETGFYRSLCYVHKPIELVPAYRTGWVEAQSDRRRKAVQLNSNVREFISGYFESTKRRSKVWSKGTLHPNHPDFLGTPKAERRRYRQYINQVRAEAQGNVGTEEGEAAD